MDITPDMLRALRSDINAALAPLATKYGLTKLAAGNASYSAGAFTMKLEGLATGGLTKEEQRYDKHRATGWQMQWLPARGAAVLYGGDQFTATGINSTGTKVIGTFAKRPGKSFIVPVDLLRMAVERAQAARK